MRAAPFLVLLLLLLGARAEAAFDVFLQITPASGSAVTGGVADPLYAGWIEVTAFEIGAERPVTIAPGETTFGPTGFREFTLSKRLDAASVALFSKLTTGQSLAMVKMVVVQRGPSRVEMWDIEATNCIAQRQGLAGASGDPSVQESVTFLAAGFAWAYTSVTPSGDAGSEYFASFNRLTQTSASGTRSPSAAGDADSDGDGIPDGWELYYGLDRQTADAVLDSDGDGLSNLHEFIAHTDPRRPQSALRVTALQAAGTQAVQLSWQSAAGLTYRVQGAPAPGGPWSAVQTVVSSGSGTTTAVVPVSPPLQFFRVVTP